VLNSVERVTAPPDFHVTLKRMLRERAAVEPSPWYVGVFNLKLAGAALAAMLLSSLILVQFVGYRRLQHDRAGATIADAVPLPPAQNNSTPSQVRGPQPTTPVDGVRPALPAVTPVRLSPKHSVTHAMKGVLATLTPGQMLRMPDDPRQDAAASVLIRDEHTEQQINIAALTLGAQSLYRSSPSSKSERVSVRERF
ncbi:MAG TPA: hypothetical protein VI756_24630, partial [Blastocatellia bacterium]